MAEGSGGGGGGSWFGAWVSTASKKSAEVFEFMKKDITELSSAVKTEAMSLSEAVKSEVCTLSEAVKGTLQLDNAESPAGNVKKSVSTFFQQLWEPETIDDQVTPILIQGDNQIALTDVQYAEHLLTEADDTFTAEIPPEELPQFEAWLSVQPVDLKDSSLLASKLASNPTLQEKYAQLVPDKVSHSDFWKRYLYRRAVLLDRLAEEERLKKKDLEVAETYPWEKEKFASDIDLSEEEQIKLLTEYEKEKNSNNQKKIERDNSSGALNVREKKDLVIVGTETPSQASVSSKESTDGDWEKEFELEEDETNNKNQ